MITCRPKSPWYKSDFRDAKRSKRRAERRYLKSRLTTHLAILKEKCRKYNELLESAKTSYYRIKIDECDNNRLFGFINSLLSKSSLAPKLPKHNLMIDLANRFANFFHNKISNSHNSLNCVSNTISFSLIESCSAKITHFQFVHPNDVLKIITGTSNVTSDLDPLPIPILKECIRPLLLPISAIINKSLSTGVFPSSLKKSLVYPMIKKSSLDLDNLANYRSVSNLPFLSKVIERIVVSQIDCYLMDNNLYPSKQSAYRRHHSTETVLLRLVNDITVALDNNLDVALILLDLSSAFDTVDHEILLKRLRLKFGFCGVVLQWIKSYLANRTQTTVVSEVQSESHNLYWGVPQGSALGPILFLLYISPIQEIALLHKLEIMIYADDTQIYTFLSHDHLKAQLKSLEACSNDIIDWFKSNWLRCNPDKTQFIHFSSRFKTAIPAVSMLIDGHDIKSVDSVGDLGVILDCSLSMKKHVSNLCSSASFALRNIRSIRNYLDKNRLERLVHAFISSKIDYCNSILYRLTNKEINKIQRIQNASARLITKRKKFDHI